MLWKHFGKYQTYFVEQKFLNGPEARVNICNGSGIGDTY